MIYNLGMPYVLRMTHNLGMTYVCEFEVTVYR